MAGLNRFLGILKSITGGHPLASRVSGANSSIYTSAAFLVHKSESEEIFPKAPKRSRSAYNIYIAERMPELKKEHSSIKTSELMKILGNEWSNLKSEEKKKYETKFLQHKKEYEIKREEWEKNVTPEQLKEIHHDEHGATGKDTKKQIKKITREHQLFLTSSGKPKKPAHAFNLFLKEKLALQKEPLMPQSAKTGGWLFSWLKQLKFGDNENPKPKPSQGKDAIAKITAEWSKISEAEKKPYMERAKQRDEKYHTEMKIWREKTKDDKKVAEAEFMIKKLQKSLRGK